MAEKIGVVEDARVVNYLPISDSMWPILDQNVWIIIKHMPERLTEGQIVAVGEYGKPFRIHRLEHVDHHKHLLYLKGVNNLYGDDPVPMRLYQGTLIGIVPYATL